MKFRIGITILSSLKKAARRFGRLLSRIKAIIASGATVKPAAPQGGAAQIRDWNTLIAGAGITEWFTFDARAGAVVNDASGSGLPPTETFRQSCAPGGEMPPARTAPHPGSKEQYRLLQKMVRPPRHDISGTTVLSTGTPESEPLHPSPYGIRPYLPLPDTTPDRIGTPSHRSSPDGNRDTVHHSRIQCNAIDGDVSVPEEPRDESFFTVNDRPFDESDFCERIRRPYLHLSPNDTTATSTVHKVHPPQCDLPQPHWQPIRHETYGSSPLRPSSRNSVLFPDEGDTGKKPAVLTDHLFYVKTHTNAMYFRDHDASTSSPHVEMVVPSPESFTGQEKSWCAGTVPSPQKPFTARNQCPTGAERHPEKNGSLTIRSSANSYHSPRNIPESAPAISPWPELPLRHPRQPDGFIDDRRSPAVIRGMALWPDLPRSPASTGYHSGQWGTGSVPPHRQEDFIWNG